MNLTNLQITIATDGFTIIDNYHDIPPGTLLTVRIAMNDSWETRTIEFNPTPTLVEAIFTGARHLFVYTGYTPSRVLVVEGQPTGYNWIGDNEASIYRDRVYGDNYACFPHRDYWTDDWLLYFLGGHVTSSLRNNSQFISGFGPDRVISDTNVYDRTAYEPGNQDYNRDRGVDSAAFFGGAESISDSGSSYREPNAY